ncbi:MAG: YiiD C-terminal domain-containing protein [Deltaproteobacteria bacterium]|jgi:thioesterase domain-containing protein|nr:YiiD C-terminal domain-containing protein [Deltaproteobacteria bacterium]
MAISDGHKELVNYLEKAIKIIEKMGMRILDFQKYSVKIILPKEQNINHIGTVYAGSLFSLADYAGGVLFFATFDLKKYYPILREVTITFKKPGTTDITCEASMSPAQAEQMKSITDETGKADWVLDLELKDEKGDVCSIVHGIFQMRKI